MISKSSLGVWCLIGTESVFFAMLIIAFAYYHAQSGTGATARQVLDPLKTGLFSLCLFSSSFTVWRAGAGVRKGRLNRTALWLVATIALGGGFLTGQAMEYISLYQRDITIRRNLFGSTFFTLTGFHGLHVLAGLIMLTILLGLTLFGGRKPPGPEPVEAVSLYWHFVDVVWVFIFSIVYLWAAT